MRGRALWTLIEIATPNSRCVNPAPNGLSRITRWFYTDKDIAGFEDQYDGGDRYGGWVFAGTEFSSSTGYFSDREDEGCSEHFFHLDDFVVSREGKLIGFLVKENKVFWIEDFVEGGKYYSEENEFHSDLIMEKWCTEMEDEDSIIAEDDEPVPDDDRPKKFHITFGYLTHSRW